MNYITTPLLIRLNNQIIEAGTIKQEVHPPHEQHVELYTQLYIPHQVQPILASNYVKLAGLFYVDFSYFTMLIEVEDRENECFHYVYTSSQEQQIPLEPIQHCNPLRYFHEHAGKLLQEHNES